MESRLPGGLGVVGAVAELLQPPEKSPLAVAYRLIKDYFKDH